MSKPQHGAENDACNCDHSLGIASNSLDDIVPLIKTLKFVALSLKINEIPLVSLNSLAVPDIVIMTLPFDRIEDRMSNDLDLL